jgi:hypothetical protein
MIRRVGLLLIILALGTVLLLDVRIWFARLSNANHLGLTRLRRPQRREGRVSTRLGCQSADCQRRVATISLAEISSENRSIDS